MTTVLDETCRCGAALHVVTPYATMAEGEGRRFRASHAVCRDARRRRTADELTAGIHALMRERDDVLRQNRADAWEDE